MMKRAASYNLATEEMINLVISARVRSGLLLAGMGKSLEINMWYPACIWYLISLSKYVSECPERNMLLAP